MRRPAHTLTLLGLTLALAAAAPSCTEVGDPWYREIDTKPVDGDADAGPSGPPTFADHVAPLFQAHGCKSCHGAFGGLSVASPEALVAGGDNGPAIVACRPGEGTLLPKLGDDPPFGDRMPPSMDPVPRADRDLIARWIARGAEQDVDCAEAGYTFEADIAPLFAAAGCSEGFCHSDFEAGGLDLRTLGGFFEPGSSKKAPVVPCDPLAGTLIHRLRPEAGALRMPPGGPYLSEDDILKVLAWIEQGAGQSCP